jgi:hypothetical protein
MPNTYYDPEQAPDAQEWLALDDQERMRLAQNYHVTARIKVRNTKAHAALHALVESQIAHGTRHISRAVDRLQKEGLTRHDAIHAVGSVLASFPYDSAHGQRELNARIDALTAQAWKQVVEREG